MSVEAEGRLRLHDFVKAGCESSEVFQGAAPLLKLKVFGLDGVCLAEVEISANATPAHLKAVVAMRPQLGVPVEVLQLVAPQGRILQPCGMALADLDIHDGDYILCVRLEVPLKWDLIGACDCCGELRHLFYGYARPDCAAELEAVTAICSACGGSPEETSETDDNLSQAGS